MAPSRVVQNRPKPDDIRAVAIEQPAVKSVSESDNPTTS